MPSSRIDGAGTRLAADARQTPRIAYRKSDGRQKGTNMEIRKWMKHPVHSVKPLDSIQHARDLMERHRVNQLPVVVDGSVIGIITDRDLRDAFPSVFDSPLFARPKPKITASDPRAVTVELVMTASPTTIVPDASMADAARLMRRQRIGALPVVDGERLVGIVTRSDVLDAFVDVVALEDMRETGLFAEAPAAKGAPAPVRKAAARARRAQ
jgi:CBS domain-containing protein